MSMVDSYSYFRSGLALALLQKAENEIRKILQKPSSEFIIQKPYGFDSDMTTFEYVSALMHLIDLDFKLNDGFAKFYHEIMEEASEYDEEGYPIYAFSLGLLADGIRKYGEEPFEELSKEADKLMRSLPVARILDMSEYFSFMMEFTEMKNKYFWELKNFAPEMKYTYLYHWDFYYYNPDEATDLIKELPIFTKKYVALYKKIIHTIQSLGGVSSYDCSGDSEKTTV